MLKAFLAAQARKFGRRYAYETGYLEQLAVLSPADFLKLSLMTPFTNASFGLPVDVYYTAKFIAARASGCSDCVMLVVAMARENGVAPERLSAAARSGTENSDMRFAATFALAVLRQDANLVSLLDEARRRFGEKGLWGLSAAIAAGQYYPTLKRGLGETLQCGVLPAEFREGSDGD